jgi:hypothetical protein
MACAAVLTLEYLLHFIHGTGLVDTENLRVTQFTTVPDRVLFMRKDDVGHLGHLGVDFNIEWNVELSPLDGNTLQVILQLDVPAFLGLQPIYTVTEAGPRKTLCVLDMNRWCLTMAFRCQGITGGFQNEIPGSGNSSRLTELLIRTNDSQSPTWKKWLLPAQPCIYSLSRYPRWL